METGCQLPMPRIRMAILTTNKTGGAVPPARWPQRDTFRELIQTGRRMNVDVFIAHPRDFHWRRESVTGYTLADDEPMPRWVRRRYPLPHVAYNRVPSRIAEAQPTVQACLARLSQRLGPSLFNPFYLSKSSVFQLLSRDDELKRYLPPTRNVTGWRDVEWMVKTYGRVYLKPARGSLGDHTVELTRASRTLFPGGYPYRYRFNLRGGRTRVGYARHLDAVRHALHPLMAVRPYIVQKAIDLARLDGRPFDLRILVQKDERGRWIMSGVAARVAGPGQITTHVPRGGRRASVEEAMTAFPPETAAALLAELETMTVAIARAVEKGSGRNFAEMSMDVGVDQQGRPWLFEVNSKPLRFDEPTIRRRAQERLLAYARYLQGYPVRLPSASSPEETPPAPSMAPEGEQEASDISSGTGSEVNESALFQRDGAAGGV